MSDGLATSWAALRRWPPRRWGVAGLTGLGFALAVAVPTDLIDTALFTREIPPTWWAWPSLAGSAALAGLLVATYVAAPGAVATRDTSPRADADASRRGGWAGAVLTFFAVGCPVCNKLVLMALGSAGALAWFEPIQPALQLVAVALLVWALHRRLAGEASCATPGAARAEPMASSPPHQA